MKVTVDRRRLRQRMIEEDKNSLIRALKKDDVIAAQSALSGMSGTDLGLTYQEFRKLTDLLQPVSQMPGDVVNDDEFRKKYEKRMDQARQILKVGKDVKQTTQTHNPVTNQPWTSTLPKKVSHEFKVGDRVIFRHAGGIVPDIVSKIVKIRKDQQDPANDAYYLENPKPGTKPDILGPVYQDEIELHDPEPF